jgi:replicative DNA helicase
VVKPSGPVIDAEQALLGALLSEPSRHRHLLELLTPGDMFRPYHGQVLAAMQRLHRRGSPAAEADTYAGQVRQELAGDPDLRPQVALDGSLLHTLMQAAPAPAHPEAYAAIVVDESVRRTVTVWGTRIAQAAGQSDPEEMLESARDLAARARSVLGSLAGRWAALPAPMRQSQRFPPAQPGAYGEIARQLQGIHAELAAFRQNLWFTDRQSWAEQFAQIAADITAVAALTATERERETRLAGTGPVRPQGPAAEAAAERAVRDVAASPAQIKHIVQWLHADDLASPQLAELFQIICDLDARGMPCDRVIIAWEATRRGVDMTPEAITQALQDGLPSMAITSARAARQHAACARVAHAGASITAAAADRARPIPIVLEQAESHLQAIDGEHQALLHAATGRRALPAAQATGADMEAAAQP